MRVLPLVVLAALAVPVVPASAQPADAPATSPTPPSAGVGTLSGLVTDAETGLPVVGAGVVIPALGIGAVSQRDGQYEIAGVPPGTHAVRTGAFRYHLMTVEAEVPEGAPGGRLDIALRPGAEAGCAAIHEHGDDGSHPATDGR